MNIFYLDNNTKTCAMYHNDKHCIKMILEYAQLLSTAHRVLDGTLRVIVSNSNRKKQVWSLPDNRDGILYSATHINHPSAIWCRKSTANYLWLYNLLTDLCKEYTYRYGKRHKVESSGLLESLYYTPANIAFGGFTEPTPAMPDDVKVAGDSLKSYRNYYYTNKKHLWSWKGKINSRERPTWLNEMINELEMEY